MVPSEQREIVDALPPDDWLTMSEAERAEHARFPADDDPRLDSSIVRDVSENTSNREVKVPNSTPTAWNVSELESAVAMGESLAPPDRMRLIARLWATLTPSERAMLVSIQFDGFGGPVGGSLPAKQNPVVTAIWRFLFDPTNTTGLYSAPRRFDLATAFVVTSAFSILFAALSLADRLLVLEFQPELTVIAGGLVTVVAIAQAWYFGIANPRGVSVIAGAIAYTSLSCFLVPFAFRSIPGFFFVVVVNGIFFGAILGYIAGVFVGGMFLVADLLREQIAAHESQDTATGPDPSGAADETAAAIGSSED
jgi:hypothetical protein